MFINCNWVFSRWQWLIYMYTIAANFTLGGLHEKHLVAILYFKLSPCFEYCIYSFGYFPGVRLWFADVSEPSVSSIFKDWM
jgi:hypothetical protein